MGKRSAARFADCTAHASDPQASLATKVKLRKWWQNSTISSPIFTSKLPGFAVQCFPRRRFPFATLPCSRRASVHPPAPDAAQVWLGRVLPLCRRKERGKVCASPRATALCTHTQPSHHAAQSLFRHPPPRRAHCRRDRDERYRLRRCACRRHALKRAPPASKHCLDVGCGVGGPMRNVARYTKGDAVLAACCLPRVSRGAYNPMFCRPRYRSNY
jgi:hypothetical protein